MMKKMISAVSMAALALSAMTMISCDDPCPPFAKPKTLAESIYYIYQNPKVGIFENGVLSEEIDGARLVFGSYYYSGSADYGFGTEIFGIERFNGERWEEIFWTGVSPDAFGGEMYRVDVASDASHKVYYGYDENETHEGGVKIAGYVGYPKTVTRCSPVIPQADFVVDLTFEFELPAGEEGAEPTAVKITVNQ